MTELARREDYHREAGRRGDVEPGEVDGKVEGNKRRRPRKSLVIILF